MRVKATRNGYYGGIFRVPDDEFDIESKSELGSWMKPVGDDSVDEIESDDVVEYGSMTKKQLMQLLDERGIEYETDNNKIALIDKLVEDDHAGS